MTNAAFGKPTSQSGTWEQFAASRAVNGVMDDYNHSQEAASAWWEVDLEGTFLIEDIDIYNRDDCCQNRLSDFYVLVSRAPFMSTELELSRAQDGVVEMHVSGLAQSPSTVEINALGRYVRVQLAGNSFMHMAEVVVKGHSVTAVPTITGVTAGAELPLESSLSIEISTEDDDAVSTVELFINDSPLRVENLPPYTWNVGTQDDPELKNLSAGDYVLRAVVTDTNGIKIEDTVAFSVLDESAECDNEKVITYFEQTCANSACHGGGSYPLLTAEGLKAMPELFSNIKPQERMVIPGEPDNSWLYKKIANLHGPDGGALMPLGAAAPRDDIEVVADWIRDGAKTDCDNGTPPPPPVVDDPNTLDQASLFSCSDPSASRSSPPRIRRILGDEYQHASQRRTDDIEVLERKAGTYFSTDTGDLSLDPGSLELLFLTRDSFLRYWTDDDLRVWRSRYELEGVHKNPDFDCIFDADVGDDCRASYVDLILRKRALFRAPTPAETDLIRGVLDSALDEAGADRKAALRQTVFTATLLPGALFRSERGDETGRLTANELALALGHILSPFPVGAPFTSDELFASDPDAEDRSLGRFTAIQKAAQDGSIFDPDTRHALLRKYATGINTERPDLVRQLNEFDSEIKFRGHYYLAPNIQKFFREWLGYEEIQFKQSAAQTSAFEDVFNVHQRSFGIFVSESGFVHSRQRGRQPKLFDALDDVIARVVIETDQNNSDVFKELMTTNHFMVPATDREVTRLQYITESRKLAYLYNLDEIISGDHDERWRELPERTGVLTHPAWLAAHGDAFEDGPSLVFRGKWIREHLFSQTVPSLEFVMVDAQLAASHPDVPARERVRLATEVGPDAQSCLGCHRLMNSLGLPFEAYNHSGFLRDYDRGNGGVDSSTVISNLPDPALNRSYANSAEFLTALSESNYARRGFIRQAFRYFMGRDETLADSCTLSGMESTLDNTGSFIDMLGTLVASDTFAYRSTGGAQ